jgi:hypothetical protein
VNNKCYPLPGDSSIDRLKQKVKRSSIGEAFINRRFRVYGVGLERTRTTFLYRVFSGAYRADHEPDWEQFINLYTDTGKLSFPSGCSDLKEWLRERDRSLRLEFESSHLLGPVAPTLSGIFPKSKFILTIRHPRDWLRSVIDWELNQDVLDAESPWRPLFDAYYGTTDEYDSPVLRQHGLYPIDGYLRYWSLHYQRILDGVPSDRLLVLKTSELSQSVQRISDFVGVDGKSLKENEKKSNKNPKRHHILDEINDSLVETKINENCGGLVGKYFSFRD